MIRHFRHFRHAPGTIAALVLLAGTAHAQDASPAASPVASAASAPAVTPKFEFAKVRTKVHTGDKIGQTSGGWLCVPGGDMHASQNIDSVLDAEAGFAFRDVAPKLGLAIASSEVSAFDNAAPSDADYRVGGIVSAIDNHVCTSPSGHKGTLHIEIKWELFSTRQQRVVVSRDTVGDYSVDAFEQGIGRDFELHEFESSLQKFFADPEVRQIMAGVSPMPVVKAPAEPLHAAPGNVILGATAPNAAALKTALVTISSDTGTGSGFFIADGYVLTNQRVVGGAKFVKVQVSNGKELIGEVVRADSSRDIALIKTDSAAAPSLRLRLTDPQVGEEVWAIGAPAPQQAVGAFVRGTLSGTRDTAGATLLQGDVAGNAVANGTPLLDAQGSAVGLAARRPDGATSGAFFLPMRDAVEHLSLVVDPAPAPPVVETTTTVRTTTTVTSKPAKTRAPARAASRP